MLVCIAAIAVVHAQEADRIDTAVRDGWTPYAIGLWGDLPYSDEQATVGVPNLIVDMNEQRLAFTVHDGDLKQGSNSPCSDAMYDRSLRYLNSLDSSAMFTPGDNDWTATARTTGAIGRSSGSITSARCSSRRRIRSVSASCRRPCKARRCVSASREWRDATRTGDGHIAASPTPR
jgi:hypothetical protein